MSDTRVKRWLDAGELAARCDHVTATDIAQAALCEN